MKSLSAPPPTAQRRSAPRRPCIIGGERGGRGPGRHKAKIRPAECAIGSGPSLAAGVVMSRGEGPKIEINPMNLSTDTNSTQPTQLSQVQRCGARARAGTPCQAPAIRGRRRCRLHGGLSPGAPKGKRNGNYTTGEWTQEAIAERRWLRALVRHCTGKGRAI